jgi:chemotaxis family two-component system response regulator Rcp1
MKRTPVILIVEDNPADVQLIQRTLREGPGAVDLVVIQDGQEAVDYLLGQAAKSGGGRCGPDLVLLDMHLPGLIGREVLERLRAMPPYRCLPVVALTTSGDLDDVRGMYAAGANTYIEKPQDVARFAEVLRTVRQYWLQTARLPSAET